MLMEQQYRLLEEHSPVLENIRLSQILTVSIRCLYGIESIKLFSSSCLIAYQLVPLLQANIVNRRLYVASN